MVAGFGSMSGCATAGDVEARAAVLSQTDQKAQDEIQGIVSEALNRTRVLISVDRLSRESTLIIDPVGAGDPMTGGRIMGTPDHFDLRLRGDSCFLYHRQSDTEYRLRHAQCKLA